MTVVVDLGYAGVSDHDYNTMMPGMEPRLRAAPGFVSHYAISTDNGFRVLEIWDSQAEAEAWLKQSIIPVMENAGGQAPQYTVSPVHYSANKGAA